MKMGCSLEVDWVQAPVGICCFLQAAIGIPFEQGQMDLEGLREAPREKLAVDRFTRLKLDPETKRDFEDMTGDALYCCLTCFAYFFPEDNRFSARKDDEISKVFKVCAE